MPLSLRKRVMGPKLCNSNPTTRKELESESESEDECLSGSERDSFSLRAIGPCDSD